MLKTLICKDKLGENRVTETESKEATVGAKKLLEQQEYCLYMKTNLWYFKKKTKGEERLQEQTETNIF